MFAIRRAAVRALARPASQISIVRPSPRFQLLSQQFAPAITRSFHQSLRWLSEEDKKVEEKVEENEIATPDVAEASTIAAAMETAAAAKDEQVNFPGSTPSSRILYIGNLFFDVNIQQLESEFSRYGSITNSRIVHDVDGRSKGFGFVEFATAEEAQEAIRACDQKVFQGRRMSVQAHVPRERKPRGNNGPLGSPNYTPREPSNTLFIGNMSFQMSDTDLNELFRDVKNVLGVRVAIDRRTGQPRGFAHADFMDTASAVAAKEYLTGKTIYGRTLRIDFSGNMDRSERSGTQSQS